MKKFCLGFFLSLVCIFSVSAKSKELKTLETVLDEATTIFAPKIDSKAKTIAIVDISSGYISVDEYLMETVKHSMVEKLKRAEFVVIHNEQEQKQYDFFISNIKSQKIYDPDTDTVYPYRLAGMGSVLKADCFIVGALKKERKNYLFYLWAFDVRGNEIAFYKEKISKDDKTIASLLNE